MANYVKLNETKIMESVSESTHVVLEDGGEVKRIPANKLGGSGSGFSGHWDDLEGKPFGVLPSGGDTLTWDGKIDLSRAECIVRDENGEEHMYYKVFDPFECYYWQGEATVTTAYPSYAQNEYDNQRYFSPFDISVTNGVVEYLSGCFIYVPSMIELPFSFTQEGLTYTIDQISEPGLYFYANNVLENENEYYVFTSSLTLYDIDVFPKVYPLDLKFLPTTVPVIKSAQPGQTVVVKAVDEQGKPTEWEARGPADGEEPDVLRVRLNVEMNTTNMELMSGTCNKTYSDLRGAWGYNPIIATLILIPYQDESSASPSAYDTEYEMIAQITYDHDNGRICFIPARSGGMYYLNFDDTVTYEAGE